MDSNKRNWSALKRTVVTHRGVGGTAIFLTLLLMYCARKHINLRMVDPMYVDPTAIDSSNKAKENGKANER